MPTATDLVTDLPADFNVFGQGVDTSMADLLGGTTGQILAKTSNTNMDFTWTTPNPGDITGVAVTSPITGGGTSGDVTIAIQDASTAQKGSVQLSDSTSTTSSVLAATPTAVKSAYDLANAAIAKSVVTTAGDIIYRNGSSPTRLAIGTAGQVLKVNSGATAPEWATASTGAVTLISQQTVTGSSVATITFSSISGSYKNLRLVYNAAITSGSWDAMYMRLNGDTGANYISQTSSAIATSLTGAEFVAQTYMTLCRVGQAGASSGQIVIPNYAGTVLKKSTIAQGISIPAYTTSGAQLFVAGAAWNNTAAITQLDITVAVGTIQWAVGSSFTLYGES